MKWLAVALIVGVALWVWYEYATLQSNVDAGIGSALSGPGLSGAFQNIGDAFTDLSSTYEDL